MERTRVVCVADDRTGAGDAGDRFAERGFETVVGERGIEAPVVALDTDSRYVAAGTAAERVASAVGAYPDALVYKKVDSTLRGNAARETAAALRASGADLALVAPAFPAAGRTTVGGIHLVEGTPVAETEAGKDPEKPAPASRLERVFADAGPVVRLDLETVARGADAVHETLDAAREDHEGPVVVCDAAREHHLDALAAGAARAEASVCYVGSAGLAGHLRVGAARPVLGAVGSVAPESLAGLETVEHAVVELDAPALFEDEGEPAADAARRAAKRLEAGDDAVLTAARSEADVQETLAAGRAAGREDDAVRRTVTDALARALESAATESDPGGLLLSGGETATAALDALGAAGVSLAGRPVEAGVPMGTVREGPLAGTPVVTKAGAFGDEETILTCLDALARYDGR